MKSLRKYVPEKALETQSDLPGRVNQLEAALQHLGEAQSTNTEVFAAGFDAADRRIFTLMRIQEEQLFRPAAIYYSVTGGIDWMQYFAEYEAMRAFELLAMRCQPSVKTAEETAEELGVTVFGGVTP